jgi:hypothetical protein
VPRVDDVEPVEPGEVLDVAGDQRQPMDQRGRTDERIAEGCRIGNVQRRRTSRDRGVDGKDILIEARVDSGILAVAHLAEVDISGSREWTLLGGQLPLSWR